MPRWRKTLLIGTCNVLIVGSSSTVGLRQILFLRPGTRGLSNGSLILNSCRFKTFDLNWSCRCWTGLCGNICLLYPDLTSEFDKELLILLGFGPGDILFYLRM